MELLQKRQDPINRYRATILQRLPVWAFGPTDIGVGCSQAGWQKRTTTERDLNLPGYVPEPLLILMINAGVVIEKYKSRHNVML